MNLSPPAFTRCSMSLEFRFWIFTLYGRGCHFVHVTQTPRSKFRPHPFPIWPWENLYEIWRQSAQWLQRRFGYADGWQNLYEPAQRSKNDVDLQQHNISIRSFMLQLTPNAVPYTYIVSERSTVTAFSYAKAYVEKMTLPKFRSMSTYSLYLNKPRKLDSSILHCTYMYMYKDSRSFAFHFWRRRLSKFFFYHQGMTTILVMWPRSWNTLSFPLNKGDSIWNMASIGRVASKKIEIFKYVDRLQNLKDKIF